MVATVVPVEIEVDDKFQPLTQYGTLPPDEEDKLSSELLQVADELLPENGYFQEVHSVKSLDNVTMVEW